MLADEPTGNLDTKNSEAVLQMLMRSNRELGQTTLMITHNPEAAAVASRILYMRDGQIVREEKGSRSERALPVCSALPSRVLIGSEGPGRQMRTRSGLTQFRPPGILEVASKRE